MLILANAKAGLGRATVAAARVEDRLRARGHTPVVVRVGPGIPAAPLDEHVARVRVVVAAGGDGTVLHAAALVLARRNAGLDTPAVYHLPCGNENLFAREFGMDRRPDTIVQAIEGGRVIHVDIGTVQRGPGERRPFLLMAGFGPDAGVIRRLDAVRSRSLGHVAYIAPILRELCRPTLPVVRVRVDGAPLVDAARGMLVVANAGRYAMRLDPARDATMTDGRLDAVFMPCGSAAGAITWAIRCRLRRHDRHRAFVFARGAEVEVEWLEAGAVPACQIDGELLRGGSGSTIRLGVRAGVLPVLLPSRNSAPN